MFFRSLLALAALWCASAVSFAQDVTPVIHVQNPPNLLAQQSKHYVVLVSLDGFRLDYAHEHGAPHLDEMARNGASTPTGMLPSYPSVTFPNHYTLVTGLRPEHPGIVAMEFYDPLRKESYAYNKQTNSDGTWYGERRCGCSQSSRACARRVSSGQGRRRPSTVCGRLFTFTTMSRSATRNASIR